MNGNDPVMLLRVLRAYYWAPGDEPQDKEACAHALYPCNNRSDSGKNEVWPLWAAVTEAIERGEKMCLKRAVLTRTYLVYLAAHDVDVDIPEGAGFELYVETRGNFIGVYQHPEYGDITIDTPHAVRITPLAPGMFILHGKEK